MVATPGRWPLPPFCFVNTYFQWVTNLRLAVGHVPRLVSLEMRASLWLGLPLARSQMFNDVEVTTPWVARGAERDVIAPISYTFYNKPQTTVSAWRFRDEHAPPARLLASPWRALLPCLTSFYFSWAPLWWTACTVQPVTAWLRPHHPPTGPPFSRRRRMSASHCVLLPSRSPARWRRRTFSFSHPPAPTQGFCFRGIVGRSSADSLALD